MPTITILAGPNGAGKSTIARSLVLDLLAVRTFVNAEEIARGLAGFAPESVMAAAEQIKLDALARLVEKWASFGFETTLAGIDFTPLLRDARARGYQVRLAYVCVKGVDLAVERVRGRAASGGQSVDEGLVRMRYGASLEALFRRYLPVVDEWKVYDNSGLSGARIVAEGGQASPTIVHDLTAWDAMPRRASMDSDEKRGLGDSHVERDIGKIFATLGLVEAAMQKAARQALRRHKLLGESVAVSDEHGKVIILSPEEIPDYPEER